MDKNILKQLKTDYEDLEIKPSDNLWEQIECELDSDSEMVKKPIFQWWKYAAVVVLLISISALFFVDFNSDKKHQNIVSVKESNDKNLNEIEQTKVINKDKPDLIFEENSKLLKEKSLAKSYSEIKPKEVKIEGVISVSEQNDIQKILETPKVIASINESQKLKTEISEKKKTSYITADDLLLGREFDRTREEAGNSRQFGVLDASKIKIKRPHSLRILGFKVFSDSISAE